MPQNNQTLLEKTVADQWQTLPSGLTVIVRPMPGYSSTHVIFATRFGSIDRDFRLDGKEVHLPAGVAHFLEHKMFEDQDGDAFAKYAKTGANANAFTNSHVVIPASICSPPYFRAAALRAFALRMPSSSFAFLI